MAQPTPQKPVWVTQDKPNEPEPGQEHFRDADGKFAPSPGKKED